MSEKPILFNEASIRAILAGRKTQTRRIMKPQPQIEWRYDGCRFQEHKGYPVGHVNVPCPHGEPGDTLWVREGYQITDSNAIFGMVRGHYLADDAPFQVRLTGAGIDKFCARSHPYRATPGRFMYKSLARIRTPVVSIRVERVQDISDQDAMAEGVYEWYKSTQYDPNAWSYWSPIDGSGAAQKFSELWDSIHGAGAWERNDWTWVVEFEEVGK